MDLQNECNINGFGRFGHKITHILSTCKENKAADKQSTSTTGQLIQLAEKCILIDDDKGEMDQRKIQIYHQISMAVLW